MNVLALTWVLGAFAALGAPAHAVAAPVELCQAMRDDDRLRPISRSLAPAARRLFGLRANDAQIVRTTVFRCMAGSVRLCNIGANLACEKADTRASLPAANRFCADNPNATFIPAVVTGHGSSLVWRCRGIEAVAEGGEPLDSRGFKARLWRELPQ